MKKKKSKRRTKHRATTQPQTLFRATATTSPIPKKTIAAGPAKLDTLTTQKDRYRYLPADLRQIGIIAGSLFLILIVLSFILG